MVFKPGQSGNPGGRPKAREFADALRLSVKRIDETDPDRRTKLQMMADKLTDEACAGNVAAAKEVADRIDGKVPQGVIGGDETDPPVNVGGNALDIIASRIAGIASRTGSPEDNK